MGQGMEMALTIAVFLGIGWGLDAWLDTQPIFMVSLVIFSTVGQFIKMWFIYDARMKVLENERRDALGAHKKLTQDFSADISWPDTSQDDERS